MRRSSVAAALTAMALLQTPATAVAGEAGVVAAKASAADDGSYRFEVTVRHADQGWKHYADRWDVLAPDGTVLATRVLLHPHVGEQPFTRSLSGVRIPPGIVKVSVRAHDSVHGYGGETAIVTVPGR